MESTSRTDIDTKSPIPLRVAAVLLASLGIFPLAAFIKYAPVVQWLPVAGIEWLIGFSTLLAICLLLARFGGARTDVLIDRGRRLMLLPSGRDFAAWAALVVLALSLFFSWYCFAGL